MTQTISQPLTDSWIALLEQCQWVLELERQATQHETPAQTEARRAALLNRARSNPAVYRALQQMIALAAH